LTEYLTRQQILTTARWGLIETIRTVNTFRKRRSKKDNTSSFHQKNAIPTRVNNHKSKVQRKDSKTEVKKTEGWKQAKLDHD
jgi:hypothetical protein